MGRDIKVQREFYRMHENVVELTRVNRLLMAVHSGNNKKFVGWITCPQN